VAPLQYFAAVKRSCTRAAAGAAAHTVLRRQFPVGHHFFFHGTTMPHVFRARVAQLAQVIVLTARTMAMSGSAPLVDRADFPRELARRSANAVVDLPDRLPTAHPGSPASAT